MSRLRALKLLAVGALSALLAAATDHGKWVNISDPVIAELSARGAKIDWPGQTAGITVDPSSGDVYVIVPGQGLWKSSDQGKNYIRCDGGHVTGRCETAFALNFDPAGKRLACFMLDGKCAMTLDSGKTWIDFAGMGRNWDYGAVDWSVGEPKTILAMRHESGGEMYLSVDSGKSWRKIATDPKFSAVGVIDAHTVLCSKGSGILRSTDGGASWKQVSDLTPIGRVMRVYKGVAWWLGRDGLLSSSDGGITWQKNGSPVDASCGPFFKDQNNVVVAGKKGFYRTVDSGKTWNLVVPIPEGFDLPQPGWFSNLVWDPLHDVFYASRMSKPAYRFDVSGK